MYQYCSLSDIINAAGWTTMADGATPVYEEYENTGDGSSTSDREYESTASGAVTMDTLFTDGYDWIDSSYPAVSSSASAEVVTSSVKASTTVAASKSTSTSAKTSKTTTSSATSSTKSNVSGSSDASESVCTPTAGGSSSVDDTPAIESAIAACPSGTILIPAGKTYYINSALSFDGCAGCTLQLEGTLMASDDTDYWNGVGAMITLESIDSATIISETGTGVFDGNGQASWDLFATDSSYDRPTMLLITKSSNVIVENIYFKDAPNVFHSCNGDSTEVAYNNITLYAVSSSDDVTAKNTDGWDIGPATYVTIQGATVTNDDDCVAFKPGASYVSVYDITCTGSHGLSVGSLGSKAGTTDTVENIYVSGATMISSSKAAGIKVYPGGYGSAVVSNVTWENVVVKDCDYAFQVQSCYGEDDDYCDDNPSDAQISGVVVSGLSGTTSGSYAPAAINIDCPADGTCGITMTDVTVEADGGDTEYLCANTSSDIGITCTDGASG
ncbi:pectin lyase fold/virulence factor [Xylariales sp. PMI_506]|nr:pectin lyase fold/virulence factor [Xylariales sp. PMI_506]